MSTKSAFIPMLLAALLPACATKTLEPSSAHITTPEARQPGIPAPVAAMPPLPQPKPSARQETYSVVVNEVPVRELLFALARDAKLNVDVHPAIEGLVTVNAINQTLPQILDRVAAQVDLRYELKERSLQVLPDEPFLKTYRIDYVNMARTSKSSVNIATSISSTGGTVAGSGGAGGASAGGEAGGNSSNTSVANTSDNRFWARLIENVNGILHEKDKLVVKSVVQGKEDQKRTQQAGQMTQAKGTGSATAVGAASTATGNQALESTSTVDAGQSNDQERTLSEGREAVNVIAHPESGVLMVRANSRLQKKVQEFISEVTTSAQRQVLIEATIVEVQLSDQFQSGVDWAKVSESTRSFSSFQQSVIGSNLSATPFTQLTFNIANPNLFSGTFTSTVKMLETFGKTKVISSPKIMALNNQTALLKVVQEKVYFTVDVDVTDATASGPGSRTFTSNLHTVPVGVVMSVTPQISESSQVSLNVRPTISNIIGYKADPVPKLYNINIENLVPEIEVREIESTLKLSSGQVAVLGGLIRDSVENKREGLPWFSRLPFIGTLTSYRDETTSKIELVIFLRPVVINDPSLNGDMASFREHLPQQNFFNSKADEIKPDYLDMRRK
jgi:general secretion pathway protein D